jgi:gamma-glutamyltranspeptidase/glutathione hydrolase
MQQLLSRREWLQTTGALGLASADALWAEDTPRRGMVVGQPQGAQAGNEVLAAGGNAVDAIVTAALVAGVTAVHLCGIGGYGGHCVIAPRTGTRQVVAIDFNTIAPRAARPDMFPLDDQGRVRGNVNSVGWLAAGVPGTLAGLGLALERFGTRTFRQAVEPAIRYARDGFPVPVGFAAAIHSAATQLSRDPGTAALLLPGGQPYASGSRFRNPDLARMLETLAADNSVDAFYRGAIGRQIAAAFQRHGGILTADDMAAYHARVVEPLELTWRGYTLRTAPLTAGGATIVQAMRTLQALGYERREPTDPRTTQLRVEALRLAWHDRLRTFGDPQFTDVPLARLLSSDYAQQAARRVDDAVRAGRPVEAQTDGRSANGTIHLSAVDSAGTMAALTLTHGNLFGAQVAVEGLGLILGHGMSRFEPKPGHPNSPGPGKRPLHNMCPTVVLRDGRPVMALGGRGGRRIPNSVFAVLVEALARDRSLADAIAAPRLHTEGGLQVTVERTAPEADVAHLRRVGYTIQQGAPAIVDAVAIDAATGEYRSAGR